MANVIGAIDASMAEFDIFNGDADGICALTQLRNAEPLESTLITGVKRDIELVAKADLSEGARRMTARLVDERQEHPSLKIKPVTVKALAKWLAAAPEGMPLIHGLTRWEVEELAGKSDRFLTDLSFAEWENSVGIVGKVIGQSRMVLGTLTPLLSTTAQVNKVVQSPESLKVRKGVAALNAERFLSYDRRWE